MKLKSSSYLNIFPVGGTWLEVEKLRRGKTLFIFLCIFVISSSSMGLFYYHLKALPLFYICMAAAFLGLLDTFLFRVTQSLVFGGNVAVFTLWTILAATRWCTGSVAADGPILLAWIWNAVVILLAIFLTGYKWGSIWACIVFLESGFSVFLFRAGYGFVNLIPPEILPQYALGFYLVGLLTVLLFAFLFEKERREALAREGQKSHALRESNKYLEDVLERSPVPTFVVDRMHRVVQWNKACFEVSGVAAGDIIGKRVWEGFSLDEEGCLADKIIDDPKGVSEKYGEEILCTSDSGSYALKYFLPNLNGKQAVMKTAPLSKLDGTVSGAIQTVQVTSDGIEMGAKPEEAVTFSLPSFRVDLSGKKISGWSDACKELFCYSAAQIIGHSPLGLVARSCRAGFKEMLSGVLKGKSPEAVELECLPGDGRPLFVLASAYPLKSVYGEIREFSVVSTDITSLKLRARESEQTAKEYKEKFRNILQEYNLLKQNVAAFIRKQN